jgi:methionine-rich copper-binding protein CopC
MRMRSTLSLVVAIALLWAVPGSAAGDRLRIEVTPRISQAPAQVRIRAIVTPSAENRGLRVTADSGEFFRSSYLPLDGADAAPVTDTSFKNLPGGEYEVSVTLVDSQGHATYVDRRTIMVTTAGR